MYGFDMTHIGHIRLYVNKEENTVEKCNGVIFAIVKKYIMNIFACV
jgi:hypothetical protein